MPARSPETDASALIVAPAAPITLGQLRDAWDEVLQALADEHRAAWMLVSNTTPMDLRDGDVLVLGFQSDADVQRFRDSQAGKPSVADLLRTAIRQLLGIEVKYIARPAPASRGSKDQATADDDVHRAAPAPTAAATDPTAAPGAPTPTSSGAAAGARASSSAATAPPEGRASGPAPAAASATETAATSTSAPSASAQGAGQSPDPAASVTGWAVAAIPSDAEAPPEDLPEQPLPDEPEPDPFSFVSAPDAPVPVVAASAPVAPTTSRGPSLDELAQSAPAAEPELSASQAARYGESVVREELGAELIEERPRVRGER